MPFLIDVLSNLAASVAFWFGLGAIFWTASRVTRNRFAKFFGIQDGQLSVVLSNAWRRSRTTRPIGYLVSRHEMEAALSVSLLCSSAPLRLPDVVRGLIDSLWLASKINCVLDVSSPDSGAAQSSRGGIIVESSRSNTVRSYLLQTYVIQAELAEEQRPKRPDEDASSGPDRVIVNRADGSQHVIESSMRLAIVEKVQLKNSERFVICCAGIRADMTACAVDYLVEHWKRIEREFHEGGFIIVLGLPRVEAFQSDYTGATLIFKTAR